LEAQATYIRLESSLYKLAMYLPHKVDGEKGSAKWDTKKETLSITLPIIRQDLVRVAAAKPAAEITTRVDASATCGADRDVGAQLERFKEQHG
jgi:hypothetical protein